MAAAAGVDGQPLGIRLRCTPLRQPFLGGQNDAWQIVAGVKGTAWNWDWDGSFNYSGNKSKETAKTGMHLNTLINPVMNTIVNTTYNPFGPSLPGAKEAIDATLYTGVAQHSKLDGYGIDFKGSGEIYQLPAGPLALAVGLQAGKTTLNQQFDPNLLDVDHYGATFYDIDQSRKVWGVFGEVNVPIFKGFEAIGQLRFDHYSDFGNTTNPKVALRWRRQVAVAARLVRQGLRGADTVPAVDAAVPGPYGGGRKGPAALPGPENENNPDCNTQYVSDRRRQPGPRARQVQDVAGGRDLGTGRALGAAERPFDRRRLYLAGPQEPRRQRHSDLDNPGPGPLFDVRLPGDSRGDVPAVRVRPRCAVRDHRHRSEVRQSGRDQDPGHRRQN